MCGLSASSVGIFINSVGVFYSPVSESLGILRGTFALHVTLSTIICAITSLYVPKIINEKNFRMLVILCILISSISTMCMAISSEMWQFILLGIIRGITSAFFGMVVITIIVNNWFIKHHGLTTSIALSFGGIAGAICSPVLSYVIETYGWNIGFIVMGLLVIIFCLPFIMLSISIKPEHQNLKPYGKTVDYKEVKKTIKPESFNFLSLSFIALFVFCLLLTAITAMPQHFPGFSQSIKAGTQVGSFMVTACMIGNIISKLLIGVLADNIGTIKSIILMMAINILACAIMILSTNIPFLLIGAFLFGSIYSISSVGIVLLTKSTFGDENYNSTYPVISFAGNIGSAFAISLIGYIYDFTGTYIIVFLLIFVIEVINLVLLRIVTIRK